MKGLLDGAASAGSGWEAARRMAKDWPRTARRSVLSVGGGNGETSLVRVGQMF